MPPYPSPSVEPARFLPGQQPNNNPIACSLELEIYIY